MSDIPLHPVLVHLPLALAGLVPLAALLALALGFRRGDPPSRKAWMAVVALQGLLAVSGVAALKSGENEEEKVEKVLASEAPLEAHAEKAELFLKVVWGALALMALGLAKGTAGTVGRYGGAAAAAAVLFLGIQVGHSGGRLVYKEGAAAAYINPGAAGAGTAGAENRDGKEKDDD